MLAIACLHLTLGGGMLRGEDDLVGEPIPVQGQNHTISLDQQMNGMFGQAENEGGGGKASSLEIDRLDAICGLSESQRSKCVAARNLDARDASTAMVALRRKYAGRTVDFQTPEGQKLWQQFHEELNAVRPFVPNRATTRNFLGRVMTGILDDRQRSAWQAETDRRRRDDWRRSIDYGMEHLGMLAGLTGRQHDELVAILLEDPPRLDTGKLRTTFGDGNPQICWYGLSRVPEDRLRTVVNERQWGKLEPLMQQGDAVSQMLKSQQLLEE
jgi:hypothetical protein